MPRARRSPARDRTQQEHGTALGDLGVYGVKLRSVEQLRNLATTPKRAFLRPDPPVRRPRGQRGAKRQTSLSTRL